MQSRLYILSLCLLTSVLLRAQNKKPVEEVAFYHLDSLTKTDPEIKQLKYFANGIVSRKQTTPDDTAIMICKEAHLKSAFNNLEVTQNPNLTSFDIPKKYRHNRSAEGLEIYRAARFNGYYYIYFEIPLDYGMSAIVLVLDDNGDLVKYKYMTAQF